MFCGPAIMVGVWKDLDSLALRSKRQNIKINHKQDIISEMSENILKLFTCLKTIRI